jgi:hypothetical protein
VQGASASTPIETRAPFRLSRNEIVTPASRSCPRCGCGPRAPSPAAAAEDAAEEVGDVDAVLVEHARVEPAARGRAAHAGLAQEVVLLALLGIGQHLVGLRDLLEALLGRRIVRMLVGVRLAHELAVGLLDLVGGRVAGDAERLVMVRHQDSPKPKVLHDLQD